MIAPPSALIALVAVVSFERDNPHMLELRGVYEGIRKVQNVTRIPFEKIKEHFCPNLSENAIRQAFLEWSTEPFDTKALYPTDKEEEVVSFFKDKETKNRFPHTVQWDHLPKVAYAANLAQSYLKKSTLSNEERRKINLLFGLVDQSSCYFTRHPFVRANNPIVLSDHQKGLVKIKVHQIFPENFQSL